MLHLIIGKGKGKTSAAAGMALRAAGHGKRVIFAQFMKDGSSGEIAVLNSVGCIEVMLPAEHYGFFSKMTEEQKAAAAGGYADMLDRLISSEAFLIVLDEALHALNKGLIKKEQLLKLLEKDCEIVLTGYDPPEYLTERADYISEICKRRHPFDRGITAREGVEY